MLENISTIKIVVSLGNADEYKLGFRYYHESKAGGGAVVEEGLPLLEQEVKNFSLIDPHSPSLEQDVKFDQNVFYIK